MLLGEELVLLLLDDDSGRWLLDESVVRRAVKISLVVELLARRALALDDSDARLVAGLAGTTGGHPVLDRVVAQASGKELVPALRPERRELTALLAGLRDQGVLRRGTFRRGRHLPVQGHAEAAVRARVLEALGHDRQPDRHTALLIALLYDLNLLPVLFADQHVPTLVARAAGIRAELQADRHYVEGGLDGASPREKLGPLDVLDGVGDALDALEGVGQLLRLGGRSVGWIGRMFDALP